MPWMINFSWSICEFLKNASAFFDLTISCFAIVKALLQLRIEIFFKSLSFFCFVIFARPHKDWSLLTIRLKLFSTLTRCNKSVSFVRADNCRRSISNYESRSDTFRARLVWNTPLSWIKICVWRTRSARSVNITPDEFWLCTFYSLDERYEVVDF